MQRRTEPQVVPTRLLLVDARDEIGLDSGHRQRAGRDVGSKSSFSRSNSIQMASGMGAAVRLGRSVQSAHVGSKADLTRDLLTFSIAITMANKPRS